MLWHVSNRCALGLIGCKNCNGYFTRDEVLRRKPPVHSWKLTEIGQRVLDENLASGDDEWPCPTCGNRTLRAALASSQSTS